jgi:2-polyprenyl-3-methyl-5-hydroxy-6-metoxy-1,4-benzoquinol methylase
MRRLTANWQALRLCLSGRQQPLVRKCPVCHGVEWRRKFRKQQFDFIECARCGLLRLDPLPTAEQLSAHYAARAAAGNYELSKAPERAPYMETLFRKIAHQRRDPGRIFDIGCFDGQLLDFAKAAGWRTAGIELQGEAATKAARSHDVSIGTVETYRPSAPHSFDVVAAIGVIEHVREPATFMALARELVAPGGLLVVQTPNYGSALARAMGRYWMPLSAPEHIHYFSHRNLKALCLAYGFSRVRCYAHWKSLRLGYAFDQFAHWGQEINRPLRAVRRFLPQFVENARLPLFGGEMVFMARAEQA